MCRNHRSKIAFLGRTTVTVLLLLIFSLSSFAEQTDPEITTEIRFGEIKKILTDLENNYPYFDLKGIRKDWKRRQRGWKKTAKNLQSDKELLELVQEFIDCLRDGSMKITNSKIFQPKPRYYSGIRLVNAGRKICVLANDAGIEGLETGTIIDKIDGKSSEKWLSTRASNKWKHGGNFSSPRQALHREYFWLFNGKKDETHKITASINRKKQVIELTNSFLITDKPVILPILKGLTISQSDPSIFYKSLNSGVGYIYVGVTSESTDRGVSEAVKKMGAEKGFIIDISNASGGSAFTLAAITPYHGNCIAIVSEGTSGFAEQYAKNLKKDIGAFLIGSTTAGCASFTDEYELPRGLGTIVYSSIPVKNAGKIIEFNGIVPSNTAYHTVAALAKGESNIISIAESRLKGRK